MAIPSNEQDESKSESGESNNNCNKTVKSLDYCLEISCTRKCKIDKTVPNCFIRSCRIVFEIKKAFETHGSCTDPELELSTDSNCVAQKSMKNEISKVVVPFSAVILVLGILMFHVLYATKRSHSRGFGAFHRVNKKTVSANKETIRNYVYTFFNQMCRKTISSFSLKRCKHILDLSNISFNSTFTVYPANTLTEYYREIESNSETSFQERMQFDMFRTSTFSEFPRNSPVSTLMLAKAGFYYEGKEDEVKCFKCGKKYRNWQQLDDPIQIHRAISPSCAFVSELGNSQNPQNQSSRGNHESVLYRREHEDMIERNENANTSEHASVSHSVHISNESIQNNDTENRRLLSYQRICQNTEIGNSSSESFVYVPNIPDTHHSRTAQQIAFSQATITRSVNEDTSSIQNKQNSEAISGRTPYAIANPLIPQSRINQERYSASALRQSNSASDHRNIPTSSESSTTENPSPEGSTISSNRPATPEVSEPINTDQPRSAASTLEPLGISIEKPRYPQFAVLATRISSFRNWPEHLHQKPEELAKAGFLYEGTNDFTRCFFCAGGLRDWEPEDNPWIEHARWYKKCVFVRQCRGGDFVNLVQEGKINEAMEKLNGRTQKTEGRIEDIMTSVAVQSVLEMGYSQENVRLAVRKLSRDNDQRSITADSVLQCILEIEEGRNSNEPLEGSTSQQETISPNPNASIEATSEIRTEDSTKTLIAENRQLKEQQICKICMDEDISIVFLPCGHMVTCVNCAPAVRKCPLCRRFIKGTVKAILS